MARSRWCGVCGAHRSRYQRRCTLCWRYVNPGCQPQRCLWEEETVRRKFDCSGRLRFLDFEAPKLSLPQTDRKCANRFGGMWCKDHEKTLQNKMAQDDPLFLFKLVDSSPLRKATLVASFAPMEHPRTMFKVEMWLQIPSWQSRRPCIQSLERCGPWYKWGTFWVDTWAEIPAAVEANSFHGLYFRLLLCVEEYEFDLNDGWTPVEHL